MVVETSARNQREGWHRDPQPLPILPMNPQSKYGGLSMRNIMIRKKLAERKRFDSADYAMQQQTTAAPTDDPTSASRPTNLHISTDPALLQRAVNPTVEYVQSPVVQIGMAAFFDSMGDDMCVATAPNSPSVDAMTLSPANRQTSVSSSEAAVPNTMQQQQAKYGALSARNIILRRKLAHGTRFDSADYQMQQCGQGEMDGIAADCAPPNEKESAVASDAMVIDSPVAAPTPLPAAPTNYGKLCAQNILIRKKLKERKRFDSADYSMEHSKGSASSASSTAAVAAQAARSMATDQHQAKLLKISVDSPKAVKDSGGNSSRDLFSPTSRVAARNVFIQRKLQERKRFDSADYFQEKQRQQQQHP